MLSAAHPLPAVGAAPSRTAPRSTAAYWGVRLIALALLAWPASFVVGYRAALAVLTVAGYAAVVAGLRRPTLGLLGVTLLCTLDAPARVYLLTGGLWRWNTLNYWLLVVAALYVGLLLRLRDLHARTLQLYVVVLAIGLVISSDLELGVQHILGLLAFFGLLVHFSRAADDPEALYWAALLAGVVASAGSLVYYLRPAGLTAMNHNAWAFFPLTALFVICLAFPFAVAARRGQIPLALLATVNVTWVFLSGSRGSLLLAVGCALYLTVTMRGVGGRAVVATACLLVAVGVSTQFTDLQAEAVHRINKLMDARYSASGRTSGRSDLALGGLRLFREHPLGVGTGSFAESWRDVSEAGIEGASNFRRGKVMQAHSAWVKTLAENGVLGAVLLGAFVLSFAVVGSRQRSRALRWLGYLVAGTLALAWTTTEFQSKGLLLFAAGAASLFHGRWLAAAWPARPPLARP